MELVYTAKQQDFRMEIRDWLREHVPVERLP